MIEIKTKTFLTASQKQDSNPKYQLLVSDTFEKIGDIEPYWNMLLRRQAGAEFYPSSNIERFISILGDADQPYVMLLLRYGRPEAMLIGRIQNIILDCKIGYLNLLKPHLKAFSIIYGGFLGKETYDVCRRFMNHLNKMLNDNLCDLIEFEALPIDSMMFRISQKTPGFLRTGYYPKLLPRLYMSIPNKMDAFYKRLSKKHRYNLQRSIRMLENHHSVRVASYRSESELKEAIALASSVAQKTYQYDFGWGFADLQNTQKRLNTMAKHGWLRFHILFIDEKPAAFQVGLQHQHTYYPELRGFDSDWKQLCIGTTLFLKVLEELCSDPQLKFLDFNPGDADYKMLFSDNQRSPAANVYFVAKRIYPIFINVASSLTRGLTRLFEITVRKIGLEHQVKNFMRTVLGVSK